MLGDRFRDALTTAFDLHSGQDRKGSGVPYFSHLMSVAALVLEAGHGEDDAIAALLHDALEDHPDRITAAELEARFGARVAALVQGCTDTPGDYAGGDKGEWRGRKERYVAHVAAGSVSNHVSLADKVHNARCIVRDLRDSGNALWERFAGERDGTLWYYRSLADAYRYAGAEGYLIEQLEAAVDEMEQIAGYTAPLVLRTWRVATEPEPMDGNERVPAG